MSLNKIELRSTDNKTIPFVITESRNSKEWCVLWLQGHTSTIEGHSEGIIRMADLSGVDFAMLEYEGHGNNPVKLEDSVRSKQIEEVETAFDNLIALGYKKIITIGGSYGGYMAALLAGKRDIHALVLRAPANYEDKEFDLRHEDTKQWEKASDRYNLTFSPKSNMALNNVSKFNGYTYVVQHELDEVVPETMVKQYFTNAKHGSYLLVPKTKHSPKLMKNPRQYFEVIEHQIVSIIEEIKLVDAIKH